MGLARTHKGWENEHLATFLLSRVAFVARPVTVADDVGTDLLCTLYEMQVRNEVSVLVPRSAIAVQVKSAREPIDMAPRLDYLARLEIPYYLGVVDQQALTLELYSARFLPLVLSFRGTSRHERLDFVPVEQLDRQYLVGDDEKGYKVQCPKVATLSATDTREKAAASAKSIQSDAAQSLKAIASRLNHEYIFNLPGNAVQIFTGPDSARTFRENFLLRLAEALHNLAWLVETGRPVPGAELDAYLAIRDQLATTGPLPAYVEAGRQRLLRARGRGFNGTAGHTPA